MIQVFIAFIVGSISGTITGGFLMLFTIAAGMARKEKEDGRQTDESS